MASRWRQEGLGKWDTRRHIGGVWAWMVADPSQNSRDQRCVIPAYRRLQFSYLLHSFRSQLPLPPHEKQEKSWIHQDFDDAAGAWELPSTDYISPVEHQTRPSCGCVTGCNREACVDGRSTRHLGNGANMPSSETVLSECRRVIETSHQSVCPRAASVHFSSLALVGCLAIEQKQQLL